MDENSYLQRYKDINNPNKASETKPLDFILPIKDKLYITVEEKAEQIGSIILPGQTRMRSQIGIVQAMGEEVKGFSIGDRVLISYGAGIHIQLPETYNREPYHRIIVDHEILSKIKEEK